MIYQMSIIPAESKYGRYDFFKSELIKSGYFDDNIYCHTTASFAAVNN